MSFDRNIVYISQRNLHVINSTSLYLNMNTHAEYKHEYITLHRNQKTFNVFFIMYAIQNSKCRPHITSRSVEAFE